MGKCCAPLLLALGVAAATAHAQVVNPDFDVGATGWTFHLDAGGGGVLQWDDASGDPAPGSVSAFNAFPGAHVDGWRQCVAVAGADYAFAANVASALQAGNSCRVTIDFLAGPDCANGTPIALEVKLTNSRNDGTFETVAGGGPLPDGVEAAALSLDHVRSAAADAGDSSCHFDHVSLGADTIFAGAFD
jgi:hypothetical protein